MAPPTCPLANRKRRPQFSFFSSCETLTEERNNSRTIATCRGLVGCSTLPRLLLIPRAFTSQSLLKPQEGTLLQPPPPPPQQAPLRVGSYPLLLAVTLGCPFFHPCHHLSHLCWLFPLAFKHAWDLPFQFQRKAMPKNAQTTSQLHWSHTLVK